MDHHDVLLDGCENWSCYPCNLSRPAQLKSTLERYRRRLSEDEKRLFDPAEEDVGLLELNDGDDAYQEGNFTNYSVLKNYLLENRKDPKCRFIFIQAANSRAALSCSRDSFSYLCCFHQVDPSFLDYVFSFGSTEEPLDYHMTGFNCSDSLDVAAGRLLNIPKLGRSGREFRMQYLLRSLERGSQPGNTGNIRQMAVYHTFDIVTGKALWINLKANGLMESRLREATADFPALGPKAMDTLAGSFTATLAAHMVHLEWCDEDWRECINEIEKEIRRVLVKAQTARIDSQAQGAKPAWTRASTMHTSKTSTGEFPEKVIPVSRSWKTKILDTVRPLNTGGDARDSALSINSLSRLLRETRKDDIKQIDWLAVLDTFSFQEVQQLHYFGELLENFRLVMDLNDQTLRDIAENYQDLWDRAGFPQEIKKDCEKEMACFLRRIQRIRRNLQVRITQVKSLMAWLREGKALFDGILQYRNVQIGRIFTESSQTQSEKMEGIAFKTEKETISMHVITSVTLAFLPAMFLTTFFQSGLVEINRDAKYITEAVSLHLHAFELFITICLPLMCFTFGLWILLFNCLSARARARAGLEKV
ncbi:hypothetical protein BHE90_004789 [Fusarium euwallaceae]|uniref:CorA-like transporter domain-containing protein n=1 Tax=Fusarium euwallaceae TaxID=1147111 RepID=A0A430LYP5_9HYPO|nr:hypothetical protein BHE90_004789 [Fusarium euwallaceae]